MSQEVIIRLRDDIDQSIADETIGFSYKGTDYEIDLTNTNIEIFDKSIDQFIKHARVLKTSSKRGRVPEPRAAGMTSRQAKAWRQKIRAWAVENGFEVKTRARIPDKVYAAYAEAHPDAPKIAP